MDDAASHSQCVNYCSGLAQNQFLKILVEDVSSHIAKDVNREELLAIIADTTPDVSHTDQLAVVARYVDTDDKVQERLISIHKLEDNTGIGYAEAILKVCGEAYISTTNIQFQCYYYTSSM